MIKITFPDDSVREYAEGTTAMQIAESISSRLAQDVLAASVNGEIWDLTRPISADSAVKLFKWDDEEGKHAFWHSSAHLMAEALQELFPGIKPVGRSWRDTAQTYRNYECGSICTLFRNCHCPQFSIYTNALIGSAGNSETQFLYR